MEKSNYLNEKHLLVITLMSEILKNLHCLLDNIKVFKHVEDLRRKLHNLIQ